MTLYNSATQENEMGELYLTNIDFLKNGVPSSIIATLVLYRLSESQGRCLTSIFVTVGRIHRWVCANEGHRVSYVMHFDSTKRLIFPLGSNTPDFSFSHV